MRKRGRPPGQKEVMEPDFRESMMSFWQKWYFRWELKIQKECGEEYFMSEFPKLYLYTYQDHDFCHIYIHPLILSTECLFLWT